MKKVLLEKLEEEGTGSTNRSTDMFTRLIKLVFGKKCPRASTSRYANTLWLADDDGIHPDDFTQYVARMGGLEKCSRLASKKQKKAAGLPEHTRTAAEEAKARKAKAIKITVPPELKLSEVGIYNLTVERLSDGTCLVLAHRAVPARVPSPGSPAKKRPATSAADKHR